MAMMLDMVEELIRKKSGERGNGYKMPVKNGDG